LQLLKRIIGRFSQHSLNPLSKSANSLFVDHRNQCLFIRK
jgi:hypothetical protein